MSLSHLELLADWVSTTLVFTCIYLLALHLHARSVRRAGPDQSSYYEATLSRFHAGIVYTTGYPGHSALKCVLPAIQEVVDRGYVDEKAIGIQGHSWGGYQIAYMVTQTNRFRAAAPGAIVANMTSAYSGIRWGTGLPRQFQYEHSQSRIGGSLWEYPMRFLDNSPVFRADRVETPLLMLHNDEDDAVPWYQDRVLPRVAPPGQRGLHVQLQRRAPRPAQAHQPKGLHPPPAGVLRSLPERRAKA